MIVDSHAHLKHGDREATEYTPEAIVAVMDAVGIDQTVVFGIKCTTVESIAMAEEAATQFPDRLIPYVFADPSYELSLLPEIRHAVADLGFPGVKIHLAWGVPPPELFDQFLHLAGELGVPCLVDWAGHLEPLLGAAARSPGTKLIVAHLGKYLCQDQSLIDGFIDAADAHHNVILDASGVVLDQKIREAVERVGSERVLFGIDGPHPKPDLVTFARAAIEQIRGLRLDPEDEAAVLGGSVLALLGLER